MSWQQLVSILSERVPSAPGGECPNDGTRLRQGPNGVLYCPFDGWRGTAAEAEPCPQMYRSGVGYGSASFGVDGFGY